MTHFTAKISVKTPSFCFSCPWDFSIILQVGSFPSHIAQSTLSFYIEALRSSYSGRLFVSRTQGRMKQTPKDSSGGPPIEALNVMHTMPSSHPVQRLQDPPPPLPSRPTTRSTTQSSVNSPVPFADDPVRGSTLSVPPEEIERLNGDNFLQ